MVIKDEKFKNQILEMYANHGNGGRIAKDLGITTYRVYKCLRANGIEPKKVGGKQKVTVERMAELYYDGLSATQVADRLNMKPSSIIERLQNAGYQLRTKSEALELCGHTKATKEREQEIISMYLSGMSSMQVAEKIGLKAKDGILRVLKKHNIPARDMYGSNNPAWKGGRLKLNKLIRNSAKYVEFRDRIFKDRNYTCEITGERGGKLEMHHIFKMSQLIDQFIQRIGLEIIDDESRRDELYDAINRFERFWDEANVMVLTEKMHKEIHSK